MVLIELPEAIPLILKFQNCWRIGGSCKLSYIKKELEKKTLFSNLNL
jgi:hypothetical protein